MACPSVPGYAPLQPTPDKSIQPFHSADSIMRTNDKPRCIRIITAYTAEAAVANAHIVIAVSIHLPYGKLGGRKPFGQVGKFGGYFAVNKPDVGVIIFGGY
jgi:hypothetical protein